MSWKSGLKTPIHASLSGGSWGFDPASLQVLLANVTLYAVARLSV